jgi:hypothetical protein
MELWWASQRWYREREEYCGGYEMKEELGLIRKTFLGYESHGMFTFVIEFDFGGSGQAFGNYVIGIHGDKSEINQEEGQ